VDVVALSLEKDVRPHVDPDKEVSRFAAATALGPLARHPHPLTVGHALGDLDPQTFGGYQNATAVAARTNPLVGIPTASAGSATNLPLHWNGNAGSTDSIPKIDLDLDHLIGSPLWATTRRGGPPSPPEKFSEKIAEVLKSPTCGAAVAEIYSKAPGVAPRRAGLAEGVESGAGSSLYAAKGIVLLASVVVGKHRVGFLDLFEPLFRVRVVGIDIRMVLASQLSIGLFDLGGGCLATNPERFVIIT
jgi:hypothetical protein